MVTKVEGLLAEALELSDEDRSQLAEELLDSLRTPEEQEIARQWMEEAERRIDEADAAGTPGIPVEEAIARARVALADARRTASRG